MLNKAIIGITTALLAGVFAARPAVAQQPGNERCYELEMEVPQVLSVHGHLQGDTLVLTGPAVFDTTVHGQTGRAYVGTAEWRAKRAAVPRAWFWVRLSSNSLRITQHGAPWSTRWEAKETASGLRGEVVFRSDELGSPERRSAFTADRIPCPGQDVPEHAA